MHHIEELNTFLKENNLSQNLSFSKFTLFPNTKILQPFGYCLKDSDISYSTKSLFGKAKSFYYDVVSPLNFNKVSYNEDTNQITLFSKFNFYIAIYDVKYESVTESFWEALDNNLGIKKDTKICKSGRFNNCNNFETSLRIFSDTYSVLDTILDIKFTSIYKEETSLDLLTDLFDIYCIDHKHGFELLESIKEKESIKFMNSYICETIDRTYYSFNALFN